MNQAKTLGKTPFQEFLLASFIFMITMSIHLTLLLISFPYTFERSHA